MVRTDASAKPAFMPAECAAPIQQLSAGERPIRSRIEQDERRPTLHFDAANRLLRRLDELQRYRRRHGLRAAAKHVAFASGGGVETLVSKESLNSLPSVMGGKIPRRNRPSQSLDAHGNFVGSHEMPRVDESLRLHREVGDGIARRNANLKPRLDKAARISSGPH